MKTVGFTTNANPGFGFASTLSLTLSKIISIAYPEQNWTSAFKGWST